VNAARPPVRSANRTPTLEQLSRTLAVRRRTIGDLGCGRHWLSLPSTSSARDQRPEPPAQARGNATWGTGPTAGVTGHRPAARINICIDVEDLEVMVFVPLVLMRLSRYHRARGPAGRATLWAVWPPKGTSRAGARIDGADSSHATRHRGWAEATRRHIMLAAMTITCDKVAHER